MQIHEETLTDKMEDLTLRNPGISDVLVGDTAQSKPSPYGNMKDTALPHNT